MRMWGVPVEVLCNKHLCGEHHEMHMFAGSLRIGTRLDGFIRNNCLSLRHIKSRHDLLAAEMLERGLTHNSPLKEIEESLYKNILPHLRDRILDEDESRELLLSRCEECAERYKHLCEP
jgi:hypothetical protein